ncbi:MAG TPA: class I SAM-dependent methyltransferase, partial [Candidatus Saccharimonadaceae bacterium]|nr:class I SAM-dependent methyltransferase [Candidatus Saccharimonadaceae bacterium]
MEKKLLDTVLKHIKHGAVTVRYWDDREETYGIGEPLIHVTIKSAKAARKMLRQLSVGFGEAYAAGDIEVDGLLDQIMRLASENKPAFRGMNSMRWVRAQSRNVRENQRRQIAHHYDIGNDFYQLWLDKSMAYSCAYYRTEHDTLETAQEQKFEHLLRKLQLKKDMRLLDIGCGWGTLLITAAREYGITGLGITLS